MRSVLMAGVEKKQKTALRSTVSRRAAASNDTKGCKDSAASGMAPAARSAMHFPADDASIAGQEGIVKPGCMRLTPVCGCPDHSAHTAFPVRNTQRSTW